MPRITGAFKAGATLATFLLECVDYNPRLLQPVTAIPKGAGSIGLKPDDVRTVKEYVADQMQAGTPLPGPGLDPSAFRMWTESSGNTDTDLARWLETEAPLGILHPVTSRHFPTCGNSGTHSRSNNSFSFVTRRLGKLSL